MEKMLFKGVILAEMLEISQLRGQNRWDELDPVERRLRDYDILFTLGDTGAMLVQDNDAGELLLGRVFVNPTLPALPEVLLPSMVDPDVASRLKLWAGKECCQNVVLYDSVRRLAYVVSDNACCAVEDVEAQLSNGSIVPPSRSLPPVNPRAPTSGQSGSYA